MAYGYTIFCDDIRDEVGGKTSFIGSYRDNLLVHGEFPFALAKFGICATYVSSPGHRPSELTLSLYLPGDDDDKPAISGSLQVVNVTQGPDQHYIAEARMLFAPLVLPRAGEIKVRFRDNHQVVKAGTLKVAKFSPPE